MARIIENPTGVFTVEYESVNPNTHVLFIQGDLVGIYSGPEESLILGKMEHYSDWDDPSGTPYVSLIALITDLNTIFFFKVDLQVVTDRGNVTTNNIIQIGGKMVAPEFEVSGASVDMSQRVKLSAVGAGFSATDNVKEERSLIFKIPFDLSGTGNIILPVLGARINVVIQPGDSDLFTGPFIISSEITGTGDFVTEVLSYKFQDAGKKVKVRSIADNGSSPPFDLFGTSADPYLYFTTIAGLNNVTLDSPVPSQAGVVFLTTIETEDGSPLNILGQEDQPLEITPMGQLEPQDFGVFLTVDTYPYSEEVYNALRMDVPDQINQIPAKAQLAINDIYIIEDSADGFKKKKVTVLMHDRDVVTNLVPKFTSSLVYEDVDGAMITAKDLGSIGNYIIAFTFLISSTVANTTANFRVLDNGVPSPDRPMTIKSSNTDTGRTITAKLVGVVVGHEYQFQWKTNKGTLEMAEYTISYDGIANNKVVQ